MDKKHIAVIGSSSMVASRFCDLSEDKFNLTKADLSENIQVDITSQSSIEDFFKNFNFEIVILFSAYTDVDSAEKQRGDKGGICWKINVEGVKNLVSSSKKHGKKLIFISTDFVFEGESGPYSEDHPLPKNYDKVSWYGITKIEGEKIIGELPSSIIIRISYPYRAKFTAKDDIAKRFLRLYRQNHLFPVFADQIITPTFIDDLAPAISQIIEKDSTGIFHVASPVVCSQFDFAKKVVSVFGGDPQKVKKGSLKEFLQKEGATPRPQKGGLSVEKIKSVGFTPTGWEEGIEKIYSQSQGELI